MTHGVRRLIISVVLLAACLALPVTGREYNYSADDAPTLYPSEELDKLYDSLPDEAKGLLLDVFEDESEDGRAAALGERLSLEYIADCVTGVLRELTGDAVGCAAVIIAVLLLTRLASLGAQLNGRGAPTEGFAFCARLVCALAVARCASGAVELCAKYVETMSGVMTAMLPVTEACLLSSGHVTQASVSGTALMLYITVTESLMKLVLVPLGGALLALSLALEAFKGVNISAALSALRRVALMLLGLFTVVFSFVLGVQSSLARSADSLAVKTLRFAVGSTVPLVGGAVSEALTSVGASLALVRQTVGGVGIVVILTLSLPPITALALKRLTLSLCAGAAELLDCGEAASVIENVGSVLSLFLAYAVLSAVFFVFYVTLFMTVGAA